LLEDPFMNEEQMNGVIDKTEEAYESLAEFANKEANI
jgi:hypothetical protein